MKSFLCALTDRIMLLTLTVVCNYLF